MSTQVSGVAPSQLCQRRSKAGAGTPVHVPSPPARTGMATAPAWVVAGGARLIVGGEVFAGGMWKVAVRIWSRSRTSRQESVAPHASRDQTMNRHAPSFWVVAVSSTGAPAGNFAWQLVAGQSMRPSALETLPPSGWGEID